MDKQLLKLEEIIWKDVVSGMKNHIKNINTELVTTYSIGYTFKEDEKVVVLIYNLNDFGNADHIIIPKCLIEKRRYLTEAKPCKKTCICNKKK